MTTLVDLFRTLEKRRGEFLVYDDGYRVRRHSYADVTRAARGFAARLIAHGVSQRRQGRALGREPPRMDRMLLGHPARRRDRRADRLPLVTGFRRAHPRHRRARRSCSPATTSMPAQPRTQGQRHDGQAGRPRLVGRRADARRRRSIATTSRRSCSRPAPPPIPRASSSAIATSSRTWCRSRRRSTSTRNTRGRSQPIRFLNLLPLSHMFGQSMATNIPPLIDGTVVFMRSFNPHDIVRRVREWRISVIVCVPKILDVLKEHALRDRSGGGRPADGPVDPGALVALPEDPPHVRAEVLGVHRRRRAARAGARGFLEAARLRRDPGLRPHRNRADRHAESSVQDEHRIGRHSRSAASR